MQSVKLQLTYRIGDREMQDTRFSRHPGLRAHARYYYFQFGLWLRRLVILLEILAILAFSAAVFGNESIVLDGTLEGRMFEGIGAVSAGASSRLLIDYPEPQRSEILDFLFKPGFGAAFQHLKVEIGGGINSTDGTEPTHMRSSGETNFNRGYEWWLMEEAVKRNPDIVLDCLAWGAPAWIGGGKYYSPAMADYIARFISGAREFHGLNITYTGVRNETPADADWVKLLRITLDRRGLRQVKIVGGDEASSWSIADGMALDSQLANCVDVIGAHYMRAASSESIETGKPLWASEAGPWRGDWAGALYTAAILNRNYIEAKITKTEIWSLISSYYDVLLLPDSGPMRAREPWSGHYDVQPAIWSIAHTTHFVKPGWKYLGGSACSALPLGGSVVSLRATNTSDFSVIVETLDASGTQTLDFVLKNGLSTEPINVWRSTADSLFEPVGVISPGTEGFSYTFEANSIYTLSTMSGGSRIDVSAPSATRFPLTYGDSFQSYAIEATPRFFADQAGTFEIAEAYQGEGKCLRQIVSEPGIRWNLPEYTPFTIIGDEFMADYQISTEALLETNGFISVFGRMENIMETVPAGYCAKIYSDPGHWEIWKKNDLIGSGEIIFPALVWHQIALQFSGTSLSLIVDGRTVWQRQDAAFAAGLGGIGCGWHPAQFRNFSLSPLHGSPNLATKASVNVSSSWSQDYRGEMAIDGDYESFWSSDGDNDGQWIGLEFREPKYVSRLVLWESDPSSVAVFGRGEGNIKSWRLQTWINDDWQDVITGESLVPQRSFSFPRIRSDKIRFLVDHAMANPLIKEIELFDEPTQSGLLLNEWMIAPNSSDGSGDTSSWVELYNSNAFPMDLSGYTLSASTSEDLILPLGTTIRPQEHLVISGGRISSLNALGASFRLDLTNARSLTLSSSLGEIVDYVPVDGSARGTAMGSRSDGSLTIVMLPRATPGAANGTMVCSIQGRPEGDQVQIDCTGDPFHKYVLSRKRSLADGDWAVHAEQSAGSDGKVIFLDTVRDSASIYRVSAE